MESEQAHNDNRHLVTLTVNEFELAVQKAVRIELGKQNDVNESDSNSIENEEVLLTRMEVADIFKVSTVTLDKWKRAGILPNSVKMVGRVYYLKEEIIQLIKKRQKN